LLTLPAGKTRFRWREKKGGKKERKAALLFVAGSKDSEKKGRRSPIHLHPAQKKGCSEEGGKAFFDGSRAEASERERKKKKGDVLFQLTDPAAANVERGGREYETTMSPARNHKTGKRKGRGKKRAVAAQKKKKKRGNETT